MIAKTLGKMKSNTLVPRIPVSSKQSCLTDLVNIEGSEYSVQTASTVRQLLDSQRLRYKVFYREYAGKSRPIGWDSTVLDKSAHHLVVVRNYPYKVVGTYRLIPFNVGQGIYCAEEFSLNQMAEILTNGVELSRACVHPRFRNGAVVSMLWKGVLSYLSLTQRKYLFGMSSIKLKSIADSPHVITKVGELSGSNLLDQRIQAKASFKVPEVGSELAKTEMAKGTKWIPPLMKMYLKAGAEIIGEPAYDPVFKCLDFFTLLDLERLNPSFKKRFG